MDAQNSSATSEHAEFKASTQRIMTETQLELKHLKEMNHDLRAANKNLTHSNETDSLALRQQLDDLNARNQLLLLQHQQLQLKCQESANSYKLKNEKWMEERDSLYSKLSVDFAHVFSRATSDTRETVDSSYSRARKSCRI